MHLFMAHELTTGAKWVVNTPPLNKKGILQTQLNTISLGERERATTSTTFGTLTGTSINHQKFFSSSSFLAWSWSSIIILVSMRLE
jgi:hypothetical protein